MYVLVVHFPFRLFTFACFIVEGFTKWDIAIIFCFYVSVLLNGQIDHVCRCDHPGHWYHTMYSFTTTRLKTSGIIIITQNVNIFVLALIPQIRVVKQHLPQGIFTSRPFLKTVGGIVLGSVAVSAVSADVLPYISFAIKASFLKLGMCNICKNNIAKMFLDF